MKHMNRKNLATLCSWTVCAMDCGDEAINLDKTLCWLKILGFILYVNGGEHNFIKMGNGIIMLCFRRIITRVIRE